MVKYVILSENKSSTRHTIKRLGLFKHDSFIQEIHYWYEDQKRTQSTMPMTIEELKKINEFVEA